MDSTSTSAIGGYIVLALIAGSFLLFMSFYRRYKRASRSDENSSDNSE
ncbi:MAG: hypothetical protein ACO29N_05970 [Candidatus Nanopelagicaceae bacterium]